VVSQAIKNYFSVMDLRQRQTNNIALIIFWSQFSAFALNTILILFLTRPLLNHGLGFSQAKAYAFIGITQATSYLIPVFGGLMADQILGLRRSILLGTILLACTYLFVMLSGYTLSSYGDRLFIAAYAMIPAANSLLMGTSSGMVSHIYSNDAVKAKSALTLYYMVVNIGALVATLVAPALMNSRFGPLSVLTVAFIGKSLAALNFAKRYSLYDNVIMGKDKEGMSKKSILQLIAYITTIYIFTLVAYSYVNLANIMISVGCVIGILWFFIKTWALTGLKRTKQMIAILLIIEAVFFFVIYNQMNSTLVLFAKYNSDLQLLGFTISPAHYQILNPLLIIALGMQLPRFYRKFPRFSIPYQFSAGTALAGAALLMLAFAAEQSSNGLINGNFIGLAYVFITLAELWVSAVGLSMIGLYCDSSGVAFAMGVWYLASSLSNTISGRLGAFVAIPNNITSPVETLPLYQQYYFVMGCVALGLGLIMLFIAWGVKVRLGKKGVVLN